jgi:hypothetical protein
VFVRSLCAVLTLLILLPARASGQAATRCQAPAQADTATLRAQVAAKTDPRAGIYVITTCNNGTLVLAAGEAPGADSDRDYGPRLFLFRQERGAPVLKSWSIGLWDSVVPDLLAVTSGGKVLVLADIGNEGSWGIETFEVVGDSLVKRGTLDIGTALEEYGNDASALPYVTIQRTATSWVASVDTAIVLAPNQEAPRRQELTNWQKARFVPGLPVWTLLPEN